MYSGNRGRAPHQDVHALPDHRQLGTQSCQDHRVIGWSTIVEGQSEGGVLNQPGFQQLAFTLASRATALGGDARYERPM